MALLLADPLAFTSDVLQESVTLGAVCRGADFPLCMATCRHARAADCCCAISSSLQVQPTRRLPSMHPQSFESGAFGTIDMLRERCVVV